MWLVIAYFLGILVGTYLESRLRKNTSMVDHIWEYYGDEGLESWLKFCEQEKRDPKTGEVFKKEKG